MAVKTIPVILTQADWNRKKGVFAKMAGETGIGAAMKAVDDEWKKVDWEALDPNSAYAKSGKLRIPTNHAQLTEAARGERGKVEAVRTKLKTLRDLAKVTETKFKASKVIPSSSRVHVGSIAVAADHLFIELKSIDVIWETERKQITQKYRGDLSKLATDLKKNVGITTARAEVFIKAVKADPKPKTFNSGIQKAARDVTQHLANVGKIHAEGLDIDLPARPDLVKDLTPWAQSTTLPTTASATDVQEAITKFEVAINAVKTWAGV